MILLWPTPTVTSGKCKFCISQTRRHSLSLQTLVDGPLSPNWVSWLMGWPVGDMAAWKKRMLSGTGWTNEPQRTTPQRTTESVARLAALGNGQVPLTAALAWTVLSEQRP